MSCDKNNPHGERCDGGIKSSVIVATRTTYNRASNESIIFTVTILIHEIFFKASQVRRVGMVAKSHVVNGKTNEIQDLHW